MSKRTIFKLLPLKQIIKMIRLFCLRPGLLTYILLKKYPSKIFASMVSLLFVSLIWQFLPTDNKSGRTENRKPTIKFPVGNTASITGSWVAFQEIYSLQQEIQLLLGKDSITPQDSVSFRQAWLRYRKLMQ